MSFRFIYDVHELQIRFNEKSIECTHDIDHRL